MITKWLKTGLIVVVCLCLVGGLLFGKDLLSYVRSSAKSVQKAVKESVPIDFANNYIATASRKTKKVWGHVPYQLKS